MLADALATFREQSVLAENLSIPMFQNRDLGHLPQYDSYQGQEPV
jgi:hypothetical protein